MRGIPHAQKLTSSYIYPVVGTLVPRRHAVTPILVASSRLIDLPLAARQAVIVPGVKPAAGRQAARAGEDAAGVFSGRAGQTPEVSGSR